MNYDTVPDFDITNDRTAFDHKSSGSSLLWLWIPLLIILVGGSALSVAAYMSNELTILESIVAGFVGIAGLFIGLIAGLFGLVIGLLGAVIGLAAAGGTIAITLFILASPVLAIVLLYLLLRKQPQCDQQGEIVE